MKEQQQHPQSCIMADEVYAVLSAIDELIPELAGLMSKTASNLEKLVAQREDLLELHGDLAEAADAEAMTRAPSPVGGPQGRLAVGGEG